MDVPHPHLLKGGVDESGVDESSPSPAQVPRPQAAQAWLPCTRACVCLAGGCCNLLAKTWQPLALTEAQLCSQRNTGIDDQDCMQTLRNHSTKGCLREGRPDRSWQSKRRISLFGLCATREPKNDYLRSVERWHSTITSACRLCATLAHKDVYVKAGLTDPGSQEAHLSPFGLCATPGAYLRSVDATALKTPCAGRWQPIVLRPWGVSEQKHSSQHAQANARQVHAIASTFDLLALAQHAHVFHVDVRRLCGEG